MARVLDHRTFPPGRLAEAKGDQRISVCLPAHNEAATVGAIVTAIRTELMERVPLVDEILVVNDRSTDRTAEVAAAAGARVECTTCLLPTQGPGGGKGEALWKSVFAADGDLIVWCDADIRNFGTHFVTGLLGPLLTDPDVAFVKGFYERPVDGQVGTGGRTTELVARPLVALLFPELAHVVQPLSGEYGGRREVLEELPFVQGYGVDLALLVDIATKHGAGAIAQVDLGVRVHRNRTLDELSPQALSILQAVLVRAGMDVPTVSTLVRPGLEPLLVELVERPPLVDVPEYRERRRRVRRGGPDR